MVGKCWVFSTSGVCIVNTEMYADFGFGWWGGVFCGVSRAAARGGREAWLGSTVPALLC